MTPWMARRTAVALCLLCAPLCAKTYLVDGIVVAVDPLARTMLVSHRPVGRWMPAMTMPFHVDDARELQKLHPGMRIGFALRVEKERSVASRIQPAGVPDEPIAHPKQMLKIGDAVPDAVLTDERGNVVRLSDFRGRVVAVQFLYTRCPLPDVCPRLAANFAVMQKRLLQRGVNGVTLLSITVDPDYDTPEVLRAYAKRWASNPQIWHFLTGDVGSIAGSLGEVYWTDEGSIGHNSSTAIIGRDGRVAALLEGSAWRPDQLDSLITHEMEMPK